MTTDLALASATELVRLYRQGSASPVEATQAVFARIKTQDGKLNAFVMTDEASAIASAKASEARWQALRKGGSAQPVGLIDGVPTTVKDLVLAKGWPTLRGSLNTDPKLLADVDAPSTARLREAGAVLIGKTTTPEYGWKGVTDSPQHGITRNPWNLDRTPGGSSGGASAAAAVGMGALHIGTDAGGSIRIPASFAGIYGLKATYGRVPAWPPSAVFAPLAHTGPMTRTVADAALMLTVMAQADHRDPYAIEATGVDWRQGLSKGVAGLKVGYAKSMAGRPVEPGVADAVAKATQIFVDLGAVVEPVELPMSGVSKAFVALAASGAAAVARGYTPEQLAKVDPGLQGLAKLGEAVTLPDVQDAYRVRETLAIAVNELFLKFDVILAPTMPMVAFAAGRDQPDRGIYKGDFDWSPFTSPINMTRHPAASMPCGFSDGLPVGLQIIGPMYREDLVLRASAAFEGVMPIALPNL